MTSRLIVALDYHQKHEALKLIDKLDPQDCALKIGNEMFTLFGPQFVTLLIKRGYKVFLDLKFHDIPNTVARACTAAAEMGVWMVNVHASGGLQMMRAAFNALQPFGQDRPLLIAVTVLTSMNSLQLDEIGINQSVANHVSRLATLANQAELDGVVCSALEAPIMKQLFGSAFITVTPGIRCPGDPADDQSRIVTPADAARMGCDYLVMGRSITRAVDPLAVVKSIISSC